MGPCRAGDGHRDPSLERTGLESHGVCVSQAGSGAKATRPRPEPPEAGSLLGPWSLGAHAPVARGPACAAVGCHLQCYRTVTGIQIFQNAVRGWTELAQEATGSLGRTAEAFREARPAACREEGDMGGAGQSIRTWPREVGWHPPGGPAHLWQPPSRNSTETSRAGRARWEDGSLGVGPSRGLCSGDGRAVAHPVCRAGEAGKGTGAAAPHTWPGRAAGGWCITETCQRC